MGRTEMGDIIAWILIIILIQIVIFILIRKLIMWYWKINKRIQLQEKTISLLQQILEQNAIPKSNNSNIPVEKDDFKDSGNLSLNDRFKRSRDNKS